MRRRNLFARRDRCGGDERGAVAVLVAVAFVPLTMTLAGVADGGRVWMEKLNLQNKVEAAALAAAQSWATSGSRCPSSALGYASDTHGTVVTCSVMDFPTGDIASVDATGAVDLYFARLIGRSQSIIEASASVRVGPAVSVSGLRPIAMCASNPALTAWLDSGMSSTNTYTVPIQSTDVACGSDVSGNWAVIDFDGGSNSMSDAQSWIANGYSGDVSVGQAMSGDPGIPSPALNLDSLVGQSIVLPVFENPRLDGARALFDVVGFVRVRVIGVQLSGSASNRHVEVAFERGTAPGRPGAPESPNFGVSSWAVCSFDGKGTCS